jgi:hypothetical protein
MLNSVQLPDNIELNFVIWQAGIPIQWKQIIDIRQMKSWVVFNGKLT